MNYGFAVVVTLNGKTQILSVHPDFATADRARAYSHFSDARVAEVGRSKMVD